MKYVISYVKNKKGTVFLNICMFGYVEKIFGRIFKKRVLVSVFEEGDWGISRGGKEIYKVFCFILGCLSFF